MVVLPLILSVANERSDFEFGGGDFGGGGAGGSW